MVRRPPLLPILLALGAALLVLPGRAAGEDGPTPGGGGRLAIDRTEHAFGAVAQEEELETSFTLSNVGDARVEGIRPVGDCGCYGVTLAKDALEPGETSTLTVRFRTLRFSGLQTKYLRIFTADGRAEPLVVRLLVDVIAGVVIEPQRVFFGDVLVGKRPSQTIRALWHTKAGQAFDVTRVDVPGHDFVIETAPIEDGDWRGTAVTLTFKDPPPLGLFSANALIRTNHPDHSRISLPLTANITGRVWVQSRVVYFGWVDHGDAKTTSLLVRPFQDGVELGDVTATSRDGKVAVEVATRPGDPPTWRRLRVTVPADAPEGRLDDVILVRTAVPGEEITEIRVQGEVLDSGR